MILRRVGRQCRRIFKNGLSSVSLKYLLRLQAKGVQKSQIRPEVHKIFKDLRGDPPSLVSIT